MSEHYPIFHMDSIQQKSYENIQRTKRLINDKTISSFIETISKEDLGTIFQTQDHPVNIYLIFKFP